MGRSSEFMQGLLVGVSLIVAGYAGITAIVWGADAVRSRRLRTGPNYAFLR
ncbi:MAG TPA: hypothetical protein VFR25_05690 [Candidatus Eisenbacteria bacterium]|nr:hypothetical protein [Candidatus Eisenbacteria bacterium]